MEHEKRRAATDEARCWRRLIIVDPAFEANAGHYHSYASVLLDAARDAGLSTALVVPRGDTVKLGDHAVHDLLSQRFWEAFQAVAGGEGGLGADLMSKAVQWRDAVAPSARTWSQTARRIALAPFAATAALVLPAATVSGFRQWRAGRRFAKDLRRVGAALGGFDPSDLIVVPNAFVVELDGACAFLDALESRPRVALLMRRDLVVEGRTPPSVMARRVRRLRRLAQAAPTEIAFLTDTAALAEQYAELTGRLVQSAPPPAVAVGSRPSPPEDTVRVLYVGGARQERGFDELPLLLDRCPPGPRRRYNIQDGTGEADDPDTRIMATRDALVARREPELTLWSGHLAPADYEALLTQADVALLPYARSAYGRRSSGVFIEALVNGVSPLVTAGTWMASELQAIEQAYLRSLPATGDGVLAEFQLPGPGYWTLEFDGRTVTRQGPGSILVWLDPARPTPHFDLVNGPTRATATPRLRSAPGDAPRSAVGLIVETVADLSEGLHEIERHLSHYRATAGLEAVLRGARHNGTALLDAVAAAPGSCIAMRDTPSDTA